MTIDERLAKLADRHEALLRSLEVTAHMQRQNAEYLAATLMDALNRLESHRRPR